MNTKSLLFILLTLFLANFLFAQEKASHPFSITPYAGFSLPQSDFKEFSDNGFVFGLSADKYISKKLALGLDFNLQTNGIVNPFEQTMLTSPYSLSSASNGDWKTTNITFGPTYKLGLGEFNAELYAKGGVSFVKSPSASTSIINGGNSNVIYELDENSSTGFAITTGIRFNYNLSPKVSLFLNPQFNGAFSDIEYCVRGFEVIEENQTTGQEAQLIFDQDVTKETLNISTVSINAGIKINLGGNPRDKVEEDPTLINPPLCDIIYNDFSCSGESINLEFTSTWTSHNPNSIIKIEVFDAGSLVASGSQISNNMIPLGSGNGSLTHVASNINPNPGSPIAVSFTIMDAAGNEICNSYFDDFIMPVCNVQIAECDFELDPTKFICDTNGITYRGISTWNNQLIGSTVNIIATDFAGNPIPLTFVPGNLPINVTSTSFGTATHDITIPRSYAGTPITLVMQITNPTTGATKNCGGADLTLPQCQNTPLCELTADVKSCVFNGKTEVNFTANWLNFLNPLGYTTQLSLFDQNGNPITANIPGNNSGIGVAGTRSFLVDLSNYEGQTITARLNVCNPSGKDCCEKEITVEIPKCCWDCDSIDTFTNTTAPNQVGNQYVVEADMTTSNDITKVVVVLDYFRAKDLPGRAVVPVNFEFLSTSRINTNQVNLMGSLTGFRSTLLQYDFNPGTQAVNFKLLIDNYYQKEMLQYRIKVTTYFDDGTYCDRFLNN